MTMSDSIAIGTIVRSESHVRYTCQVYGPGEVASPPRPVDYGFSRFVRVPLRAAPGPAPALDVVEAAAHTRFPLHALPDVADVQAVESALSERGECWAVGLIYDTILLNPAFGALGPRLSSESQNALFAPDYLAERAVLVSILLLGTLTPRGTGVGGAPLVSHGVPPLAPDLGALVSTLPDGDLRAFHHFSDGGAPGGARPYLHMGYLPHAIAQENPLLPVAMLRTIERLEQLFPDNRALLSIVKRNFAWRLKVQAAG